MLTFTPIQVNEVMQRGAQDKQVVTLINKDIGAIYIDEQWLSEFRQQPLTIYEASDIQSFAKFGKKFWPGDDCVQRLQAVLDFNQ